MRGSNCLFVTALFMAAAPAAPTATAHAAASAFTGPKVSFYQTFLLESYCARLSPAKPDPATIAEIGKRLPEFRAAWAEKGDPLLAAVVRTTNRPFRFGETVAVLHACPDLESWSVPFTVAAARYTQASGGVESGAVREALAAGKPIPKLPPQSLENFVYVVWHELMHRYVQELKDELPGRSTPIQRKYAAENDTVRDHIGLFAVEKLIWQEMRRSGEYEARAAEAKALGYKSHYRAMEIVEAEGAENILKELRRR